MNVHVVTHDPRWAEMFEIEAKEIQRALQKSFLRSHHIGSTAIPDILAKPIIDVLVEVRSLQLLDSESLNMKSLGYCSMGEYGIPGRRYFRKENSDGVRTHHVHAYERGDEEVELHLAFRDYMRAHPESAQKYSVLKKRLAERYPDDIEGYMDGKHDFVQRMERLALEWTRRH